MFWWVIPCGMTLLISPMFPIGILSYGGIHGMKKQNLLRLKSKYMALADTMGCIAKRII